MAILPNLPGLEVNICVQGYTLDEHDDDEEFQPQPDHVPYYRRAKVVSKYIESQTNQVFYIRVAVYPPYEMDSPGLKVIICIDGERVAGTGFVGTEFKPADRNITGRRSRDLLAGTESLHPFKFARLRSTLDDDKLDQVEEDTELVKQIGEITVSFYRQGEAVQQASSSTGWNAVAVPEVHEKALKGQAKSHSTSYGQAILTNKIPTQFFPSAPLLDGKNFPVAVFRFKYRSKEALRTLLILERTPEPDQEEVKEEFELDVVEIARPAGKRRKARKKAKKLGKETHEAGGRMVIDLTGDSD